MRNLKVVTATQFDFLELSSWFPTSVTASKLSIAVLSKAAWGCISECAVGENVRA